MAKPTTTTTTTTPAPQGQPTPTVLPVAALLATPVVGAYMQALATMAPHPYAPKPPASLPLALGPAGQANPKAQGSATHGRWAAMAAGMAAAQATGQPYTVAMALAAGLPLGDLRWALSPHHRGGAQLVVATAPAAQ